MASINFEEKIAKSIENINTVAVNNKIPAWHKPIMESIKTFAEDVTSKFSELQKTVIDLEGRLGVQKSVTDALALDRERISKEIRVMEVALEDQRQYTRRNMILVHGVQETAGREDTDDTVLNIFNKDMEVQIQKSDINRSHRLGRRYDNGDQAKSRPIIVSFTSYRNRKLIFDNKKNLKGKKTVITESLSKERYALLKKCKETYGPRNCWTYDGRIYYVPVEGGNKFCVTNEDDLAERRL